MSDGDNSGGSIKLEGYKDDKQLLASLRASVRSQRGWTLESGITWAKVAGAAAIGTAITAAITYVW